MSSNDELKVIRAEITALKNTLNSFKVNNSTAISRSLSADNEHNDNLKFIYYFIKDKELTKDEDKIKYNEDFILNYKEYEDKLFEECKTYIKEEIHDKIIAHLTNEVYNKLIEHINTSHQNTINSLTDRNLKICISTIEIYNELLSKLRKN